jgi:integrase
MRRMEADLFPAFGSKPIAEIESPDVLDALREVESRGSVETARRLKQTAGQIFRFAIVAGYAKRDPSADLRGALKAAPPVRHHKAMPRKDLRGFLRSIISYDGELSTRLGLRLIVLTFLRTTELRAGRWEEVENLDGVNPLWRIPADRMKRSRDHLVPLSRQAVSTLQELRPLAANSPFIFPSAGKEQFMSNNTLLYALYRMGFHGRATIHGFRSLASTILNEKQFNADWIEMQLSHVEKNKVRGAYNAAQWLPGRTTMMQWWADHLDDIAS